MLETMLRENAKSKYIHRISLALDPELELELKFATHTSAVKFPKRLNGA